MKVLLLLLPLLARSAGAAEPLPAVDGSGTLRLDGGQPVPEGGGVVDARWWLGERPAEDAAREQRMGIAGLVRPLPGLELGVGLPEFTRRDDAAEGHIFSPGRVLFVARAAVLPELPGVAVSLLGALPVHAGEAPAGVEPRVAVGRELGRLRAVANAGLLLESGGGRAPWAGAGLRADLGTGILVRGDLRLTVGAPWSAAGELALPVGAGAWLVLGATRTEGEGDAAPGWTFGGAVLLRTSASGPGAPLRFDRDGDGVLDAEDACPRTWGDGPDGCPAPIPGLSECGCPLRSMSLYEIERLVAALSAVPPGEMVVIEVRVEATGDVYEDWERTEEAVEGTRAVLLDLGVPPGNFAVAGRRPISITGIPSISIRQMPIWNVPAYLESVEFQPPSVPRTAGPLPEEREETPPELEEVLP